MGSNSDDFDFDDYDFGDGSSVVEDQDEEAMNNQIQDSARQMQNNSQNRQQRQMQPRPRQQQVSSGQQKQRQQGNNQQRPKQQQGSMQQVPKRQQQENTQQRPRQQQNVNTQRKRPQQREIPIQEQRYLTGDRMIPNQSIRTQSSSSSQQTRVQSARSNTKKSKTKKKKSKLPLIIVIIAIIAIIFVLKVKNNNEESNTPVEQDLSGSNKEIYDALLAALNNYDAESIDSIVGSEQGDSYLAQEWSYANCNQEREKFISTVCSLVDFNYPETPQLNKKGEQMMDDSGNPIMLESTMSNNEAITVTYIDYNSLIQQVDSDKDSILQMYENADITSKDYLYNDEMVDLMLKWINSKNELPTTSKEIQLKVDSGVFKDDIELDCLLFSSDEFHNLCDKFSQVASGWTGFKTEKYTEKEEQLNPEYAEWKALFDAYYKADKGKFKKGVSKWEPWYLRDDNNNYILDEDGKKIVNYYSVKDKDGNDWIQPSKKVLVDVKKKREVEDPWVPDSVIPYCFIGAYYCQNQYDGSFSPDVKIGDGSLENPAGVGTPIVTKCLGTDGKYHDVKVTLMGYWKGQDAIDYALSFSEKNRGFDVNSVVQLICYEIKVENLEDKKFSFDSEMFLSDRNSNQSQRAGTMYGFTSSEKLKGHQSVIINDWDTSTEIDQKYVCWGSSFNRKYDVIYFRALAGEGNVEPYSAYKSFTGESHVSQVGKKDSVDDSKNVKKEESSESSETVTE